MNETKLCELYDSLENEKIEVVNFPSFETQKSVSFDYNNKFYIGINNNLVETNTEMFCVLAEEKAHYDVGILPNNYKSNSYADLIARSKNEHRAKKLAVNRLVPINLLKDIVSKNPDISIWDLADIFDVTIEFMNQALLVYNL